MNDPGSLQNLNDIVLPDTVAWWPPAPGWYVVLAILLVALLWLSFRVLKWWRRNTYRRQALRALVAIEKRGSKAAAEIPVLLKRTALSAWPRADVAVLSGSDWHAFLDASASENMFSGGAGQLLDRVAYGAGRGQAVSAAEFTQLCEVARLWLRRHQPDGA